jgi:hypothetical protein
MKPARACWVAAVVSTVLAEARRVPGDSGGRDATGVVLVLERQAGDLPPVGGAGAVALAGDAAAGQVLDYW